MKDQPSAQRRLTAVLCADVVGYSRLMQADEQATHAALTSRRRLFGERVAAHGGRIVNAPGDSIRAEFASVVEAVDCALEIQRAVAAADAALAAERRMQFRIGINLGDVLVDADGIYGDGVNIAARLESLCAPGGVAVSASVYEQLRDKRALSFVDRGEHAVKNIARRVRVYALEPGGGAGAAPRKRFAFGRRKALAALGLAGVLAAGFALAPQIPRWLHKPAGEAAATIAVLPFANQS